MTTALSRHAEIRMKERNGLPKKAARRMAEKVYLEGTCREDTRGQLRKWLDQVYDGNCIHYNAERELRVHGDSCYIYGTGNTLVTVLKIPQTLARHRKDMVVAHHA